MPIGTKYFARSGVPFLVAWAILVSACRAVPPDVGGLIWSDEFNGSTLDPSKWNHRQLGARRDAVNVTQAVTVGAGALTIKTYTEAGVHYTGMIGTQNLLQTTYGYFEARAMFNSSPGQWSAFWVQSPTFGNPIGDPGAAGTEIDVVEHRATNAGGTGISNRYSSVLHWDGYAQFHQSISQLHGPLSGLGNGSWHTYGLKWTPQTYTYYFDDSPLWTLSTPISHRSEYLILSSEVQNNSWAGLIPGGGYGPQSSSTTNMQVDYVRVYALPEPHAAGALLGFVSIALCRRCGRKGPAQHRRRLSRRRPTAQSQW